MQLKYLPKINEPKDFRNFSKQELVELCQELREYTIETITGIGGHLGSNFWVL